ncbi:MAG: hypothetical protein ACXWMK_08700, partial [Syntrophales bacterium]
MSDSTTNQKPLTSTEQAQLVNSLGRLDKSFDRTQTIDINTLVCEPLTASGTFDLRQERIDAFGKLLQALSIPTVLIERSHKVEFANTAFISMLKGSQLT